MDLYGWHEHPPGLYLTLPVLWLYFSSFLNPLPEQLLEIVPLFGDLAIRHAQDADGSKSTIFKQVSSSSAILSPD